eukprot:TRINITY_DN3355_c0_g1_i16.p2 TRINITY_DN3355_c0_g1~~TRINITY_DN3355_c0_g1_i16.p2  ORF type:complete len:216 (+),score=43.81 TRINITY_DN3355_c0_g1_i16:818-1465(+)
MSEIANGANFFLDMHTSIPTIFQLSCDGTITPAVTNVQLLIEISECVTFGELPTNYPALLANDNRKISINLGNLVSEEERHLLFPLEIQKSSEQYGVEIARLWVYFTDAQTSENVVRGVCVIVDRPLITEEIKFNQNIHRQAYKQATINTLNEAKSWKVRGNYEKAIEEVKEGLSMLKARPLQDPDFNCLLMDLEEYLGELLERNSVMDVVPFSL